MQLPFSVEFVNELRRNELREIRELFPGGGTLLEIGAGTGEQARLLAEAGFTVTAIDIADGTYAGHGTFPVAIYDGHRFPAESSAFDIVYTSNVLEHVRDVTAIHSEIRRVLRRNGVAIHVVPTHSWRLWTTLSAIPAIARPRRHGERGNLVSEHWLFHPRVWRQQFRAHGFAVETERPVGFWYTGNQALGPRLKLKIRRRLALIFGSACHVFVLRPSDQWSSDTNFHDSGPH